ncbi:MAG TPA: condensation domain-containing protein [Chthoniobacterales bacterium]|nr:condensation domain-containing protein [Chthoniobacterales bacterium]
MSRNGPSRASVFAPVASEAEAESAIAADARGDDESVFVFPASPAQRRFWLLDQLQPGGNPALNLSLALGWHGPLDQSVLRRALNEVVARHEALRTTFDYQRGELRQLIAPSVVLELPLLEARDFPGTASADLPARVRREEAQQPLDLLAGPLVRARLLRLAPDEHLLLLTVHHIVSDGWSNSIILRDLCSFYTSFTDNTPLPLPELTLQFADFADWQNARLAADDFAPQREYWRQKLAGDLPGLDLPYDRPRRAALNVSGDVRSRLLPPELVRAATTLAASESASPFMIYFAVFQVLLHRYTGQVDFLVTSPSANRDRRDFESLVGLFVNPLLLRADLRGDPSFRELLGRVRAGALEAFSNQDIPFESLLDEFQAARLQVNFHYDGGLQQPATLPDGVTLKSVPAVSAGTVYELSASVLEDGGDLRLELEYNTTLFDAETIDRMLGHYQTLLENVVADPAAAISKAPLLTCEERQQLGLEPGPLDLPTSEALDIRAPLVERVMAKPDAVAARHGRRELSCAELLARMESARNADKSDRAPSDLDQAAMWVAHWRARVETPPPVVRARPPAVEASIAAASVALREWAGLDDRDRIASCTEAGVAATEEIGAALLANALLVYPTPGLLVEPPAALAAWLETENISVACMAAATWNRFAAVLATRKVRKPAKLRLVLVTEGEPGEGSFGRVVRDDGKNGGVWVSRRTVLESGGATIALDNQPLPLTTRRLHIRDPRSSQPLPAGVIGELFGSEDPGMQTSLGQLARWLPGGLLDRLGPANEQSYARGFRLDPRRVETALCAGPGIRHALVRPASGEPGARFVAYVLPDVAGSPLPSDDALRESLHEQGLPHQAVPALFIAMKEIALSPDGHFDRTALPPIPQGELGASHEPVQPYIGLQLQLIAIWEDVLGVRGIGIRDDFFELGGNSLLAMRMLQRAELACGKVILPSALFRNPTVEHLAGEIAREVIDESPTLLRVNDAGSGTPFFYLHGDLSGGGFYSLKLSRALGPDQPFYVLPPQDIRLLPAAPSIEEMAAAHLAALRAVRPKGPYVIGGFCIGGLVAYELAQQIEAGGDAVEMLLVIDAAPEDKGLRALRWLAGACGALFRRDDHATVDQFGRWVLWRGRLSRWYGLNVQAQARIVFRRVSHRFVRVYEILRPRFRRESNQAAAPAQASAPGRRERDVPSAFLWASARYRPRPYRGAVALLLSEDVVRRGRNVVGEWQELAPDVTMHPLIGSHLECITAHVDTLAQTIERCLQDTAASTRAPREDSSRL